MVKPLAFKGDPKPRKRKRKGGSGSDGEEDGLAKDRQALTRSGEEQVHADDNWVTAEVTHDIAGPVIFALPSEHPTCLACDVNGKVFASRLENIIDKDLATAEPHDVRQVWVANRIAGMEGFSFKGHHGR